MRARWIGWPAIRAPCGLAPKLNILKNTIKTQHSFFLKTTMSNQFSTSKTRIGNSICGFMPMNHKRIGNPIIALKSQYCTWCATHLLLHTSIIVFWMLIGPKTKKRLANTWFASTSECPKPNYWAQKRNYQFAILDFAICKHSNISNVATPKAIIPITAIQTGPNCNQ